MTDLAPAHASLLSALRERRNRDGGWPYYPGRSSRLESTVWASLAVGEPVDRDPLASWRRADGLLIEPATGQLNIAFNALAALAAAPAGAPVPLFSRDIAVALLGFRGETVAATPLIRQDPSLQAWPWTPGTVAWVEPTCWCLLALKRILAGEARALDRIDQAERMLRDRECPDGGWNFGNGEVYGKGLPAHVPPTAAGILALQDRGADALVEQAVRFVETHAPGEGSTMALALSLLAFIATGHPSEHISALLSDHAPDAIAFGNLAAIGMAAYALGCALRHERPLAFTLPAAGARS